MAFPAGLVYDGEKFGTAILPSVLQIKRTAFAGVSSEKISFGEPCPIELEYPRRGLLPSEGYYQCFISYKLYPWPQ